MGVHSSLYVAVRSGYQVRDFIIAAEQGDARMMPDTPDVVCHFAFDVFQEGVVEDREGGAGEFQVLPDADARLVAGVEQGVVFIVAAAPEPECIHVGVHGIVDKTSQLFLGDTVGEGVGRNPVGSLGKELTPLTSKCIGTLPFFSKACNVRSPIRLLTESNTVPASSTRSTLTV